MKITMNDSRLINVTQLQEFLKGSQGVNLSLKDASLDEKYKFINETIKRLAYSKLSKKEKRIVYVYLRKITGYKKAQLYRLMKKAEIGRLKKNMYQRVNPHKIYTSYDIKLLEKTDEVKDTEPQVLFIERCLDMLKDGGKLAIVLPETYFHAPNARYVLDYMRENNNFVAIVDLAHNTFRPFNNAKTVLLVLEKGVRQQQKIVMCATEEIGHDHNGKPIYRYNKEKHEFSEELWDDTSIVRRELDDPSNSSNKNVFLVDVDEIKNDVYVPRYYWRRRIEELKSEADQQNLEFVQVKELLDKGIMVDFSGHGSPAGKYKGKGTIPYVRVADIVNWGIYKNPTSLISEHVYKSIRGNGVNIQEKDILFVRRGSYRIGSVALVSRFDTNVLLTREIHVFRIENEENEYDIDAFYLLYLFSMS